jgi:hypothetical protein
MQHLPLFAGVALALSLTSAGSDANELWTDIDGDGRDDLVLVGPDGRLQLLFNGGDGQLRPAGPEWGLAGLGRFRGATAGDADGDGFTDLFLYGAAGGHRLLLNRGTAFTDVTASSGVKEIGALAGAGWLDYDGDGRLDLRFEPEGGGLLLMRNTDAATFVPVPITEGASGPLGLPVSTGAAVEEPGATLAGPSTTPAGTTGAGGSFGRPSAGPRGSNGAPAGNPQAVVPGFTIAASPGALVPPFGCAMGVADQAGGPCIEASLVPTPGMLLPLGPELTIAAGRMGVFTESPGAALDVHGGNVTRVRLSSHNLFGSTSSLIEMALDRDYDDGMEFEVTDEGLGVNSRVPAQGGFPKTFGPHLFIERTAAGYVGIGEDAPVSRLHVDGSTTVDGDVAVRRPNHLQTILLQPDYAGGGGSARVLMSQSDGALGLVLDAENSVNSGSKLTMYGDGGTLRVELDADDGGSSFLRLYKSDNTVGIHLDADQNGDARITTEVLEITGGADLVESFDTGEVSCAPGSVVAIDPDRPGELTLSSVAYDRRVAGVVSGAGGVQPGLHMGQTGVASGSTPVALTGRVYVRCSDENGAVRPGDLLTTSSTEGVAMKATDTERSFGAVLGKAMTPLEGESGLVLVLVNLQ